MPRSPQQLSPSRSFLYTSFCVEYVPLCTPSFEPKLIQNFYQILSFYLILISAKRQTFCLTSFDKFYLLCPTKKILNFTNFLYLFTFI